MLGTQKALGRRWLLTGSTWLVSLSSCSGAAFTSNGTDGGTNGNTGGSATAGAHAGGSSNGATGGSDSAGDSGAGAPDKGGSTGTAGTMSGACECKAGYYCRDGSLDCFDCAELNRLHFATPERLATVSDSGQAAHFPRVGATPNSTDLLYRLEGTGLRYTADSSTSPGANVKGTGATDSGPLLLTAQVPNVGAMTMTGFNFLFDRTEEGRRSIYVGEWNNGLVSSTPAPAPYNETRNDYSIAVALKPTADGIARAFWMTDRDQPDAMETPRLVTALAVADAPPVPVGLELAQKGCNASDADLAPWVTSDGKTLLVSHTRVDANCKGTGQGKDIYTALLQPDTGEPTAPALPMNDVNGPANDVEPSFSADLCDLYFASDRDGKYALYRAHRR
jgi:hypothetical protein